MCRDNESLGILFISPHYFTNSNFFFCIVIFTHLPSIELNHYIVIPRGEPTLSDFLSFARLFLYRFICSNSQFFRFLAGIVRTFLFLQVVLMLEDQIKLIHGFPFLYLLDFPFSVKSCHELPLVIKSPFYKGKLCRNFSRISWTCK